MIQEEIPIWVILVFMWLLVPVIARPFSRRGLTKVEYHLRQGRLSVFAHLYSHSFKAIVLVLSYYSAGFFMAVVIPFFQGTPGFSWSWLTPFFR